MKCLANSQKIPTLPSWYISSKASSCCTHGLTTFSLYKNYLVMTAQMVIVLVCIIFFLVYICLVILCSQYRYVSVERNSCIFTLETVKRFVISYFSPPSNQSLWWLSLLLPGNGFIFSIVLVVVSRTLFSVGYFVWQYIWLQWALMFSRSISLCI